MLILNDFRDKIIGAIQLLSLSERVLPPKINLK